MTHTLTTDIYRAIKCRGFYIACALTVICLLVGASGEIVSLLQYGVGEGLYAGFHAQLLLGALSSSVMTLALPIICALPYTTSMLEDEKSGYVKPYILRTSRAQYIRAKIIATALSGGLSVFVGIMLCYLLFALVFAPLELAPLSAEEMMGDDSAGVQALEVSASFGSAPSFGQPSMFMEILGKSITLFLFGALWSLVGLTLATSTGSRYMAYASPFIIYYVLIILAERYFTGFALLNPKEWIYPTRIWPGGSWGICLLMGELVVLMSLSCTLICKKRLGSE